MKKFLLCLPLLLVLLCFPVRAAELEMRGVWVSSVYNLDYPSRPGLSEAQLRAEADAIIANAQSWGMNAIFLQVRPMGDALYTSNINPWSAFLSGTQGQAPAGGFDPLAYFIEQCHDRGMELHAWLNPYRLTRTAAADRETAFAQLCESHPARKLSDCVVFHSDGCLYYDPGRPEVQAQILDTVSEILDHYAVDGIHLDDYFYPGSGFGDEDTYANYGGEFDSVGDFRRDAVDRLVAALHKLVEDKAPGASFGISPAGIWATADRMAMGVLTSGSQSYFDQYADSRKWVREGMVDYIAPQIYWEMGAASGEFQTVLDWWCDTVADTDVKLYIGLAAYKSAEAEEGSVWYGTEELKRQLYAILDSKEASGAVLFRYGSVGGSLPDSLSGMFRIEPPRVSRWPEELTVDTPETAQAVLAGETLGISCTAPRGSTVTVFYGSGHTTLKPDLNGGYSGYLTAETPYESESYTAPALICAEKHGILTVKLTPFTVTSVQAEETVSIEDILWGDREEWHEVVFSAKTPAAAVLDRVGDVVTLDISPCRLGVLFKDPYFSSITAEQLDNTTRYRLVLPDDGQSRQLQLLWEPDKITLRVRKTQPDLPEADR